MDHSVTTVAEILTHEFAGVQCARVASVLTACADEYPHADSLFIEQAARARLRLVSEPQGAGFAAPGSDALDVSLHDDELAAEVELTVRLMVAANESDQPLAAEEIDRLLGVERRSPNGRLPSQRTGRR